MSNKQLKDLFPKLTIFVVRGVVTEDCKVLANISSRFFTWVPSDSTTLLNSWISESADSCSWRSL